MPQEFYSEEEAEQILRLAARQTDGAMSRDRLMQSAAELGISPEAVARAEAEIAERREEETLRAEFAAKKRSELVSSVGSYLGTNLMLVAIWAFAGRGYFWPIWPILGWGIGVVGQVIGTSLRNGKEYEIEFQKWKARRERKAAKAGPPSRADSHSDAILDRWFESESPDSKLSAIKHLRDETNLGLKEAKDAVDLYYARQGWE